MWLESARKVMRKAELSGVATLSPGLPMACELESMSVKSRWPLTLWSLEGVLLSIFRSPFGNGENIIKMS